MYDKSKGEKMNSNKNEKNHFPVIITSAFILLIAIMGITRGDIIYKKLKYEWNSVSVVNETQKIFYIKSLLDTGLYPVTKIDKFKEIVNKKEISSFKNEKTKFDYNVSEKNDVLTIKINNLPQAECEAFYKDRSTSSKKGIKTILNNRDIHSIKISNFEELNKECYGYKNSIEFLLWKF